MKIRQLSKDEVEKNPYSVWNAFVDLLSMERYENLTAEQRAPHLVFWYESEVQNGGHLQYFENRRAKYVSETFEALGLLGAKCQQMVLRDAAEQFFTCHRPPIQSVEEYSATSRDGEFSVLDTRFYECTPTLIECLEVYLKQHQASFVIVT